MSCRYDSVTLLFSGIVGFAQYCAANTDAEGAMKIVKILNELYTIFDALCDTKRIPNIYKVSLFLSHVRVEEAARLLERIANSAHEIDLKYFSGYVPKNIINLPAP